MTAGEEKEAFVGQTEGQLDEGNEVLADLEGQEGGQRRPLCMPPCRTLAHEAGGLRCSFSWLSAAGEDISDDDGEGEGAEGALEEDIPDDSVHTFEGHTGGCAGVALCLHLVP